MYDQKTREAILLSLAVAGMWTTALHRAAASLPALLPALADLCGEQLRFGSAYQTMMLPLTPSIMGA